MSLYNMLHGFHPAAAMLLEALEFDTLEKRAAIPRFRDIYLFQDEIRLLTRTGGGNRPDYEEENTALRSRSDFIKDWDDGFDSTFAWWAYKWPEDWNEQLQHVLEQIKEHRPDLLPKDLEELTNAAVERIQP